MVVERSDDLRSDRCSLLSSISSLVYGIKYIILYIVYDITTNHLTTIGCVTVSHNLGAPQWCAAPVLEQPLLDGWCAVLVLAMEPHVRNVTTLGKQNIYGHWVVYSFVCSSRAEFTLISNSVCVCVQLRVFQETFINDTNAIARVASIGERIPASEPEQVCEEREKQNGAMAGTRTSPLLQSKGVNSCHP